MHVQVQCTVCKKIFLIDRTFLGTRRKCPGCDEMLIFDAPYRGNTGEESVVLRSASSLSLPVDEPVSKPVHHQKRAWWLPAIRCLYLLVGVGLAIVGLWLARTGDDNLAVGRLVMVAGAAFCICGFWLPRPATAMLLLGLAGGCLVLFCILTQMTMTRGFGWQLDRAVLCTLVFVVAMSICLWLEWNWSIIPILGFTLYGLLRAGYLATHGSDFDGALLLLQVLAIQLPVAVGALGRRTSRG